MKSLSRRATSWFFQVLSFIIVMLVALAPLRSANGASIWTGVSGLSWATAGNWNPSGGPGVTDTASFTDTGSTSLLGDATSLLNTDRTIGGLSFSNTANHYHALDLGTHILTINGNLNFNTDQSALTTTTIRNGSISINSAFANINVGRSASSNAAAVVDFSGLTSLSSILQSIQVGASTSGSANGSLRLSPSNIINAQFIYVGVAQNSQDVNGTLHLGLNNIIQTPEFDVATNNANGLVDIVNGGSLTLGTSTQRTLLQIANQTTNTNNTYTGSMNLGNAAVNMRLDSLIVGQKSGGSGVTVGQLFGGSSGSITIGDPSVRGNWYVGHAVNGGTAQGSVDFSHMTTLQAYLGDWSIGKSETGQAVGAVLLAGNNTFDVANNIVVGAGGFNSTGTLTLGTTNAILANQLIIGQDFSSGSVKIPAGGTLNLGSPTQRTSILLANSSAITDNVYSATLDLTGATLNAYVGDLIVGQRIVGGGNGGFSANLIGGSGGSINIGAPGNSSNIYVGRGVGGSATGSADFSGLSSLIANVNTVAVGNGSSGSANGTLKLAATNTINATSILVGVGGAGSNGTLVLGQSSNVILTNQIIIGQDFASGLVRLPSGGTLTLGSPSLRTALYLANTSAATNEVYTAKLDLTGGTFNAYVSDLIVGQRIVGGGNATMSATLLAGNTGSINIGTANSAVFYVARGLGGSITASADFSGLNSLTASLNTLAVGNGIGGQATGTLKLAATNSISSNTILIGVGAGASSGSVTLGLTNTILANQLTIGQDYASGALNVPSGATLTLGSPSQRTSVAIGTGNANDNNTYTGTLDASNASVTAYLDAVTLGSRTTSNGNETATLNFSNHADNHIEANTVTIGGSFTTGNLTFAGGVFYAGTINAGTGTANFNWTGGQLSVTTFGSPSRLFNLSNGGTGTLAPGSAAGAIGTTTINGNYAQGASASANIRIAGSTPSTGNDLIAISGAATLAGTLNLSLSNSFVPTLGQNFLVATYASRTGTFAFVAPPVLPQNVAFQLDYTSNTSQLIVHMVAPAIQTWTSTAATASFSTPGNWNTASSPTTTSADTIINATATPETVTVSTSTTVHAINLSGTTAPITLEVPQGIRLGVANQIVLGANASLIGGGQVLGQVVNGAGASIVPSSTLQVTGSVANSGLVTVPTGATLNVGGTFTQNASGYTIGTGTLNASAYIINAGTLQLGNGGTTGTVGSGPITNNGSLLFNRSNALALSNPITGSGTLTQSGAGTTTLSAYQGTGPVNVTAGQLAFAPTTAPRNDTGVMIKIQNLTMASNTVLDMTNHDLIIGNTNYAIVSNMILAAFHLASGPALTTSTSNLLGTGTDNALPIPIDATAFGLTSWDNVTITEPNSIIVKDAISGDASLDGVVNIDDYAILASHFNHTTPGLSDILTSWLAGDFSLDGVVNIDDYAILAGNFNKGPLGDLESPALSAPVSSVPEPASLLLLGMGLALATCRKKKPAYRHSRRN